MIYEAKSKENSLILNSVDEVLAHILATRKIGEKERLEFLYPDINDLTQPCLYSNVDKIVVRVNKAITNKEKILIYGDYDCDGVCAVAILYNFFKDRDIDCNYFIPLRDEGYGLNIKSLDKIKQEYSPDLIITVDCGISSVAEVEECKKLGMEIIVTDHHEPGENLPNALIFNPKLDREKGLFSEYCGAGVAFKLVEAISGLDYAKKYLDVVSIATIGDIVPLVKDNRAIVKFGLCEINKSEKKVYKIFKQKLSVNEELTSYDIAFKIVPRINAAGRLSSADKAVELFISDDYFNLTCLIEELCTLNTDRQKVCNKIYKEAVTMLSSYDLSNRVIILKNPDWDAGVLGIVSSKITEEFNKPTILMSEVDGLLKGSARSIEGLNIFECLKKFQEYFISFGGHSKAAGITMKIDMFDEFTERINEFVSKKYPSNVFMPTIKYDCEIDIDLITLELSEKLKLLEPFGEGNEKPVFLVKKIKTDLKQIGKSVHIKGKVKDAELLGYNRISELKKANYIDSFDVIGYVGKSEFNNKVTPKLTIEKIFFNYNSFPELVSQINYYAQNIIHIDEKKSKTQKILTVSLEQAVNEFNSKEKNGVVFIVYEKNNYEKLKTLLNIKSKYDNIIETEVIDQTNGGGNLILIGAQPYADLSKFSEIIFLESVIGNSVAERFKINSKAQVYTCNLPVTEKPLIDIEYEEVAKSFKNIKSLLNEYEFNSMYSLINYISVKFKISYEKLLISVYILIELKILKFDEDGKLAMDNVQNPIQNSTIYNYYKKYDK